MASTADVAEVAIVDAAGVEEHVVSNAVATTVDPFLLKPALARNRVDGEGGEPASNSGSVIGSDVDSVNGYHQQGRSVEATEYEAYLNQVEASLTSVAEAADQIQNGERADLAVAYIMHLAGLLRTSGNAGVPLGQALQVASATLAKEKLMATVASSLRVGADILENRKLMQGLSSTVQASGASFSNDRIAAAVNGTIETAGVVLESEVVRKQIVRASSFAEQLMSDPAMQEQGKVLAKQLEDIGNNEDVQEALDSALTLAQSTLQNERLRRISSASITYAGAIVESRLVQSTSSGVACMANSATPAVSSLLNSSAVTKLSSTVSTVAGSERVQNAVGVAVDTTGAVLTSQPVLKATKLGWSTTLTVAGGVARLANSVKKVAFPEKTLEEMEADLNALEEETDAKLTQLQLDQIQLAKEEEDARVAARAALARLRENQSSQQELRAQVSKRKRQLMKRKAAVEGVEFDDDASTETGSSVDLNHEPPSTLLHTVE